MMSLLRIIFWCHGRIQDSAAWPCPCWRLMPPSLRRFLFAVAKEGIQACVLCSWCCSAEEQMLLKTTKRRSGVGCVLWFSCKPAKKDPGVVVAVFSPVCYPLAYADATLRDWKGCRCSKTLFNFVCRISSSEYTYVHFEVDSLHLCSCADEL